MDRIAVIDLGTNTFHLLIVERAIDVPFRQVFRQQVYAKLGIGGVDFIIPESFERGLATLEAFQEAIAMHGAESIQAFGTAALRTASNAPEFMEQALLRTGIPITLISGEEEARLIYRGVSWAVPIDGDEAVLVMDIGGGSVEFIIANGSGPIWYQSFPVGVAVLFRGFHHSDPIVDAEIEAVVSFLEQQLQPLLTALRRHPVSRLIGAAGAFDVVEGMILPEMPAASNAEIPLERFPELYRRIIAASLAERLAMPGLPHPRADMIVVAFILIDFVMRRAGIQRMTVAHFSLKEGMIRESFEA